MTPAAAVSIPFDTAWLILLVSGIVGVVIVGVVTVGVVTVVFGVAGVVTVVFGAAGGVIVVLLSLLSQPANIAPLNIKIAAERVIFIRSPG